MHKIGYPFLLAHTGQGL